MTDEQRDAIVGKALRDYNENDRKMRLLVARARQIGQQLCTLGELLRERPFGVVSTASGFVGGDVTGASSLSSFSGALDYSALVALENDVRLTATALREARDIKDSVC